MRFDSQAQLLGSGTDRAKLATVLEEVAPRSGRRVDLGLVAAEHDLSAVGAFDHRGAVVLLVDGRSPPDELQLAVRQAAQLRDSGGSAFGPSSVSPPTETQVLLLRSGPASSLPSRTDLVLVLRLGQLRHRTHSLGRADPDGNVTVRASPMCLKRPGVQVRTTI